MHIQPPPPPQPQPNQNLYSNNGFSTAAIILGIIAFLFFPIIFGPIGIVLAAIALSRGEEKGTTAMLIVTIGTVMGMVVGCMAFLY